MKDNAFDRRTFVKFVGAGLSGLSVGPSAGSARETRPPDHVPAGEARALAAEKRRQLSARDEFDRWSDATLGGVQRYYMPVTDGGSTEYEASAYVFSVTDGSDSLGYITASARRSWAPILEYSRASPPRSRLEAASDRAAERDRTATGRLLYAGAFTYSYEIRPGAAIRLIDLRQRRSHRDLRPSSLEMEESRASSQREALDPGNETASATSSGSYEMIYGVPAFVEESSSDDGSSGAGYPDNVGTEEDPWDGWDGCIPYAGANVLGYHEGISDDEWESREALIDRLHEHMNTSEDGWTEWSDIAPGIEAYSAGQHDYSANTPLWLDPGDMKNNVENGRPHLLNMNGGGKKDNKDGEGYGDHSVAVVGYEERSDGTYWAVHDGWEPYRRWLQGGNWEKAKPNFVSKN